MKAYPVLSWVSLVVLASVTVVAQDPVKVASANYKVVVDNPTVRVLRVSVPANGKTAMHSHPENLVIPLSASKVRFETPDGKSEEAELGVESAVFQPVQTHAGTNLGSAPVDAIVVEFKGGTPGAGKLPSTRDNMALKVLAEGARASAVRATADPAFHEPAGSTHDFDQLVIALGSAQMSLSIDAKPAKTTWTRGEVAFIPRGTPHESKNASGQPVDFIIVAIK